MNVTETEYDDVDGILLVPDRKKWRALMNTVINLQVP
jgi:hypothetical protein